MAGLKGDEIGSSGTLSADGATTAWYENPPVLHNYTNHATTGDFAGNYERRFSGQDQLTTTGRHGRRRRSDADIERRIDADCR